MHRHKDITGPYRTRCHWPFVRRGPSQFCARFKTTLFCRAYETSSYHLRDILGCKACCANIDIFTYLLTYRSSSVYFLNAILGFEASLPMICIDRLLWCSDYIANVVRRLLSVLIALRITPSHMKLFFVHADSEEKQSNRHRRVLTSSASTNWQFLALKLTVISRLPTTSAVYLLPALVCCINRINQSTHYFNVRSKADK